jgi:hypothetical protein
MSFSESIKLECICVGIWLSELAGNLETWTLHYGVLR